MEEEHRGVALVILGIIAIIAVIGLVLMFSGSKNSTGAIPTLLGTDAPSGFCDSPCTFAFGASQSEVAMQTQRFIARGFVPVGQVNFKYSVDGFGLYGQCVCPPEGIPQFVATPEQASIVYGTPLSGRSEGTIRHSSLCAPNSIMSREFVDYFIQHSNHLRSKNNLIR
ncbi:MAG: hypothetical protein NTW67_02095 [Candidatus Woesearchaeota archaeon]|nr:hypothetical protein [Candidatus Woesearchaeota archaeon]